MPGLGDLPSRGLFEPWVWFFGFFPDLAISSQPFQSEQQKAAAPPHMNSYQSDSLQMQAVEETLGIISKQESYFPPIILL